MATEDHERLGDELDQQTGKLERESEQLGEEIDQVRSDWRTKQQDPSVPGAVEGETGTPEDGDAEGETGTPGDGDADSGDGRGAPEVEE
jgi:hypothetical protein